MDKTVLPRDLCHLVAEYLDTRPSRLMCCASNFGEEDLAYLSDQGINCLDLKIKQPLELLKMNRVNVSGAEMIVGLLSNSSDDSTHHVLIVDVETMKQVSIPIAVECGLFVIGSLILMIDHSVQYCRLDRASMTDMHFTTVLNSNLSMWNLSVLRDINYNCVVYGNSVYAKRYDGTLVKVITVCDDSVLCTSEPTIEYHLTDSCLPHGFERFIDFAVDEGNHRIYHVDDSDVLKIVTYDMMDASNAHTGTVHDLTECFRSIVGCHVRRLSKFPTSESELVIVLNDAILRCPCSSIESYSLDRHELRVQVFGMQIV